MHELIYTLSVTSPVFILIALGFFTTHKGYLDKNDLRSLSWFVLNIGVPAAIYSALSSRSLEEILRYDYLLIYGLGSLLTFAIIFLISKLKGKSLTEASMFGMGSSLSNSILIGYPIVLQIFGPAAVIPFALTLIVENMLMIPLTLTLADTGQKGSSRFGTALLLSLKQLGKNPIFIAICLGILTTVSPIRLPSIVLPVIEMLAATVAGLALFTIGGLLVGIKPAGMLGDLSIVVIGKLILHPACILLLIMLMPPMTPLFQSVAIMLAAMPMFSVYAMFGTRYAMSEFCSAVLLVATLMSFVTISLAILILGPVN